MDNRKLLSQVITYQQLYDPFASPPNLQQAQQHQQAMSVGIDTDDDNAHICACCNNVIEKKPIQLACREEELLFLGVGYPLYFKLTKYIMLIIMLILLVSGSGFYMLVTLKCQSKCVFFFGLPIINLEMPIQQSAQLTDFLHVITAIAIFVIVVWVKSELNNNIEELESKVIGMQDYTILLRNLDENVQEEELVDWAEENLGGRPVLVNFGYEMGWLQEALEQRHQLTIQLNKLNIQHHKNPQDPNLPTRIYEVQEQIQLKDRVLNHYKIQNVSCKKNGTAFLTFSRAQTVQRILSHHESTFFNTYIRPMLSLITPSLTFHNRVIIVQRAPAPKEVIWENLHFSYYRNVLFEVLFVLCMLVMIWGGFKVQVLFTTYAFMLKQRGLSEGEWFIIMEALVMSGLVVGLNSLLRLVIKLFTYLKRYHSYSSYHSSFCFYYSLMYIFNSCFMMYIVHDITSHRTEQEEDELLLYDIHLIMLANAFSEPLFKVLDPMMWGRFGWKYYVKSLKEQDNPYTQGYVHKLWEGPEILNADNYQYVFRMLVVTTWFAHSAPLAVVISLFALCVDYCIGKYMLLRVYRHPENISKSIARPIIGALPLLPIIYIWGILQFTYKVSTTPNIFLFFTEFFQYSITTTVMIVCMIGYLIVYGRRQKSRKEKKTLEEMELSFLHTYQTQNPMTKLQGEIKFLYGVLRKGKSDKHMNLINELLSLSHRSKESFIERQSLITKIRRSMFKRATTLEMQEEMQPIGRKRGSDWSE